MTARSPLAKAVHALAHAAGWSRRRAQARDEARILMFHGVGDGVFEAPAFERLLVWLRRHFEPVSLPELLARRLGVSPWTGREVVLTFDDGLRNNATIAYPLLQAHEVPATFFVCPGLIESRRWLWNHDVRERLRSLPAEVGARFVADVGAPSAAHREDVVAWMKTLDQQRREEVRATLRRMTPRFTATKAQRAAYEIMSWDELGGLDPELITIGSHTMHHPILTTLAPDQVEEELAGSRQVLEAKLGRPVDLFCYPNGAQDESVRAAARRHYAAAVTTGPGLVARNEDAHCLSRIGATPVLAEMAWRLHRP